MDGILHLDFQCIAHIRGIYHLNIIKQQRERDDLGIFRCLDNNVTIAVQCLYYQFNVTNCYYKLKSNKPL